jgi:hypothetical protein
MSRRVLVTIAVAVAGIRLAANPQSVLAESR